MLAVVSNTRRPGNDLIQTSNWHTQHTVELKENGALTQDAGCGQQHQKARKRPNTDQQLAHTTHSGAERKWSTDTRCRLWSATPEGLKTTDTDQQLAHRTHSGAERKWSTDTRCWLWSATPEGLKTTRYRPATGTQNTQWS